MTKKIKIPSKVQGKFLLELAKPHRRIYVNERHGRFERYNMRFHKTPVTDSSHPWGGDILGVTQVRSFIKIGWLVREDTHWPDYDGDKSGETYDLVLSDLGREAVVGIKQRLKETGADHGVVYGFNASKVEGAISFRASESTSRAALESAFHDTVLAMAMDKVGRTPRGTRDHERLFPSKKVHYEATPTAGLLILPEHAHSLRNLRDAIEVALDLTYKAGLRKGGSLLESLSTGALSLDDFNDGVTGAKK